MINNRDVFMILNITAWINYMGVTDLSKATRVNS